MAGIAYCFYLITCANILPEHFRSLTTKTGRKGGTMDSEKDQAVLSNGNKSVKKKDAWKISGLINRITELIFNGTFKDKGINEVYGIIRSEFAEQFKGKGYSLDKQMFVGKVNEILWSNKMLAQIKEAVRHRMDMEEVYKSVSSYIPHDLFVKKWNSLRGKSAKRKKATEFVRGILRLSAEIANMSDEPVKFKSGIFANPFVVPDSDDGGFLFLNGVNLGIPYSGLLEENPARQALENARYYGDSAVVLTNLLDIDTKKASGPIKVYRALLSGRNVNPDDLDPEYAKKAKKILEEKSHGEMIFQNTAEIFEESMRGWTKIVGTNDKPVFNGPVCIVLGYRDEEIITAGAYWEAHHFTIKKQNDLQIMKRILQLQIARAKEDNNKDVLENLEIELENVSDEVSRTTITNITSYDLKRYYYKVLRFVIKKLEETIPNSKVIGIGTSFISMGGDIIEVNIPRNDSPGDDTLANYCQNHGPRVLRGKMASNVVICHPFAINYKMTVREVDADGKRGQAQVFVAPIAVDDRFIRGVLRDTIRKAHRLSRAMLSEQFKGGVLRLRKSNGMLQPHNWSIGALQDFFRKLNDRRSKKAAIASPKYIWVMVGTDPHFGSPSREIISAPDGRLMGVSEAVMDMMRSSNLFDRNRMPVHMFVMNDDPTQGHHFENHTQPDPQKMGYADIEKRLLNFVNEAKNTADPIARASILNQMKNLALTQFWLRGEHWAQDQIEDVIERLVDPNVDFFDAILRRASDSGLIVKGVSHFSGAMMDKRDVGLINIGTGNHFLKTADKALTEGFIYARILRARLSGLKNWSPEIVDKLVKSPLYGNQFIAWGTIQVPGGYEFSLDLRDTPTGKGVNWNDPLQTVVRNDLQRGNYNRIMNGRFALKIYGDKHFFSATDTEWAMYVMSPADAHTDKFGELGFPPNNTGASFVGLPVDGPGFAPILVRTLPVTVIKKFFEQGIAFDWDSFLPNPA